MSRLPWTKFQDFYLRLGFLKVLVAALSPQRRSVLNDVIVRRLQAPLFDPVQKHDALWSRIHDKITWHKESSEDEWPPADAKKKKKTLAVAEALLVDGNCPSFLFAITGPTAYKIADWARDVELLGRANQITERGLLLRHLLHEPSIEAFLGGDVESWNPFVLSSMERDFFLFHLNEIDEVTVELIGLLASHDPETGPLEAHDAAKLTCRALIDVLTRAKNEVQPRDIPAFRIASELTATIADELSMLDDASHLTGGSRPRARIVRPAARHVLSAKGAQVEPRRTTKNADHQTIPRFEQLVDLGFLEKPAENLPGEAGIRAGRRRWRYLPTEACRRWAAAAAASERKDAFKWNSFASVCLKAFAEGGNRVGTRPHMIASYLWKAYERIRRPAGQNPFDSVALFAMLLALSDGVAIEMSQFHQMMLTIKQRSAFPNHAFFASGNDIDQMFIQLKSGFVDQVAQNEAIFLTEGPP